MKALFITPLKKHKVSALFFQCNYQYFHFQRIPFRDQGWWISRDTHLGQSTLHRAIKDALLKLYVPSFNPVIPSCRLSTTNCLERKKKMRPVTQKPVCVVSAPQSCEITECSSRRGDSSRRMHHWPAGRLAVCRAQWLMRTHRIHQYYFVSALVISSANK